MALAAASLPAIGILFGSSNASAGTFVISSPSRTPIDNQPTQDSTLLLLGRKLVAAYGTFTLSGQAQTLTKGTVTPLSPAGPLPHIALAMQRTNYIYAATRNITVNGQAVTFRRGIGLAADYGTFTLSGAPAERDLEIDCETGYFSAPGRFVTITVGKKVVAAVGTFTLTGQAAAGAVQDATNRRLPALTGFFVLTGQEVGQANRIMACESGAFTISGYSPILDGPTWISVAESNTSWDDVAASDTTWTDV